MSSTNKTEYFSLNSWVGADVPKREDFVNDNVILDNALNTHFTDTDIHITAEERTVWNTPFYIQRYVGTGEASKTITVGADFQPSWGLLFATSTPMSVSDFNNESNYNYFALFTKGGGMDGVSLDGSTLTVTNSSVPYNNVELACYNSKGVEYYVIFAR